MRQFEPIAQYFLCSDPPCVDFHWLLHSWNPLFAKPMMKPFLVIFFLVLWSIDGCGSFYQSGSVFPVYHSWKAVDVQKLRDLNSKRKSYGVSLFPLVDAKKVNPLLQYKISPSVCVMDVEKMSDLHSLYEAGCRVVNLHIKRREIIREAHLKGMSIICSGTSVSDYCDAVMLNVHGFRLVWDRPVKFIQGKDFVDKILLANKQLDIPLFISPVTEGEDMERLAAVDSMVHFMIGFRIEEEDQLVRVGTLIDQYDERLRKAYLDLNIKNDLHSSCL